MFMITENTTDETTSCSLLAINQGEDFKFHLGEFADNLLSGKSSVLEGLTGLPFPRDSGLCTRFATQITFRRSLQKKITISIIPTLNADKDYANKLRAWVKADLQTLGRSEFSDVLREVSLLSPNHL